jgi:hypothetical protein
MGEQRKRRRERPAAGTLFKKKRFSAAFDKIGQKLKCRSLVLPDLTGRSE